MLSPANAPSHVHVESTGRGDPFVLLHGWAMHGGVFAAPAAHLAARFRVRVVDLPGHGHSTAIEPYTLDGVVAAVDRAFAREAQPLTVLGWSFGGLVALRWALLAPERVARLVLVCTTPKFVAGDDWPHAMSREMLERFSAEFDVAWKLVVQRFLALQVQGSEHARAVLATLRGQIFAHGEPSLRALRGALGVLAATDLRAEVAGITQPALVIGGGRDALASPVAAEWLAAALPDARFALLGGAAHAPFLSHPDAFGRALDGFLDDRRPALRTA